MLSADEPVHCLMVQSAWELEHTETSQIDALGRVYRAQAFIENRTRSARLHSAGVDDGFVNHGGLPLHIWDIAWRLFRRSMDYDA